MKIVLAPDKFKGSISAMDFCIAARAGLQKAISAVEVISMPLSDGGDGFLEVVSRYGKFNVITTKARDPLFRNINTSFLISSDQKTAIIELAKISGLTLLTQEERNCMLTTSYGFGQLINEAISMGAKNLILSLGGSATNDAGIGMAMALGYSFLDSKGRKLKGRGKDLCKIVRIIEPTDRKWINDCRFTVLTDVTNVLTGIEGAVNIYARQKGAKEMELPVLEKGMVLIAEKFREFSGKEIGNIPGAGAAGGLGAGAIFFLGAKRKYGSDFVIDISGFEQEIDDADLIITGEGKMDIQSNYGKLTCRIANIGIENNIPVIVIAGEIESNACLNGLERYYSLLDIAIDKKDAFLNAEKYVKQLAYEIGKSKIIGNGKSQSL